jgi:hypothetical protein
MVALCEQPSRAICTILIWRPTTSHLVSTEPDRLLGLQPLLGQAAAPGELLSSDVSLLSATRPGAEPHNNDTTTCMRACLPHSQLMGTRSAVARLHAAHAAA